VYEREERFKEDVVRKVREIRYREPRVGVRKLFHRLRRDGIEIGRDKLFDILRDEHLLIQKRKSYVRTTQSNHWMKKYRNKVKDLVVAGPEQVYVSDITYIATREGFCYLSLITDRYSRRIMGWNVSQSLSIEGSMEALTMALRGTKKTKGLIHHSDRGIQYCSKAYVEVLKKHEAEISMTEENHVYENALAERVNGILKDEFLLGEVIRSYEDAKQQVAEAIETYNTVRLHMAIGYVTPAEKHAA
jgi:transposase InsO family protein